MRVAKDLVVENLLLNRDKTQARVIGLYGLEGVLVVRGGKVARKGRRGAEKNLAIGIKGAIGAGKALGALGTRGHKGMPCHENAVAGAREGLGHRVGDANGRFVAGLGGGVDLGRRARGRLELLCGEKSAL